MAKDSSSVSSNVFNQSDGGEEPDSKGDDLYFGGWDEIIKMHLAQTGDMESTANSRASHDVYGRPAAGEPNPAGVGSKRNKGGK